MELHPRLSAATVAFVALWLFCNFSISDSQELCSLGTLPNSLFSLTPGVHYWLTQAFSCDGYVSRVRFHYRGGSEETVMNLSVSVWSATGGSSYSLQGERVIAVATLEDTSQDIPASYSFSMYDEPILMVSENDYIGFSFNSSLTNSGNQEPLLGTTFSILTRYNRYEGIRGDTVDTSSFMNRGGRIAFSVDVDEFIPTTSVNSPSSSASSSVSSPVLQGGSSTSTGSPAPTTAPNEVMSVTADADGFISSSLIMTSYSVVPTTMPTTTSPATPTTTPATTPTTTPPATPTTTPPADSTNDGSSGRCGDMEACRLGLLGLFIGLIVISLVVVVIVCVASKPWRIVRRLRQHSKNKHNANPEAHDQPQVYLTPILSGTCLHTIQPNPNYEEQPYCEIDGDSAFYYNNTSQVHFLKGSTETLLDSDNYATLQSEDIQYECPMSDESGIYCQLKRWNILQIDPGTIDCGIYIGAGNFANVFRGTWRSSRGVKEVAVKILKDEDPFSNSRISFLQEVAIMAQFQHPNVVKLYGTVTDNTSIMMVLEFMEKRDLFHFVQGFRPTADDPVSSGLPNMLIDFSHQVACGMNYLHYKSFVHRDLAARNVFVNVNNVCKIGDFGMARDLDSDSLYLSSGGTIPLKWTAPEAIIHRRYSSSSDMWSFGVVLYEIWSLGHRPFEHISNEDILRLIMEGSRLLPPPGCPRKIYRFMILCWHPEPDIRPLFRDAVTFLSQSKEEVLAWTEADKTHPDCTVLGADLSCGENLYKDLQETYIAIS